MPLYRFKFVGPTDAYMSSTVGVPVTGDDPTPLITKDIYIDDAAKLPRLRNAVEKLQGGAWLYTGEVT